MAEAIPVNAAGTNGLIRVMNNEQINAAEKAAQPAVPPQEETLNHLSGRLSHYWQQAKTAKQEVSERLLKCKRQIEGEYEPDVKAAITAMGGSDVFMMITAQKKRDLRSWLLDILKPTGPKDRLFSLSPTPIPDLPPDIEEEMSRRVMNGLMQELTMRVAATGEQIGDEQINELMGAMMDDAREKIKVAVNEKGVEVAERMSVKIDDQMVEGKWYKIFKDVIDDFCSYPSAIMKVPVVKRKKRKAYVPDPVTGKWGIQVKKQVTAGFSRVSPWNFFPGPDTNVDDEGQISGYTWERHRYSRKQISNLIGNPGYKEEAIRRVLQRYKDGGLREWLWSDSEQERLDGKQNFHSSELIDALEFYGPMRGQLLLDWGMDADKVPDADMDYEITAIMIGGEIIKAIVEPDKLDRKPYLISSFEKVPGLIWGKSLPEILEDTQSMCNVSARSLHNNVAIASGPMVEVDESRVDLDAISPWMIIRATADQMNSGKAANFYTTTMHAAELMQVYIHYKKEADNQSGVPAFAHGDTSVGGAGNTSSGLSMMMSAAGRGIKASVSNIDIDIIVEGTERMYDFNMLYDEDESIKGDARVKAGGSASMIAKEQLSVRQKEFMDSLAGNEMAMQLVGLKGLEYQIEEGAKAVELDPEKLLQGILAAGGGMPMGGGAPGQMPGAANLLPDGSPAGGEAAKTVSNEGGS